MPVRPILHFPDPRLRQISQPVVAFDDSLHRLVTDMTDTLYLAEGAGLAAIQVGEPLRLFIIDPEVAGRTATDPPLVVVNPELLTISEEQYTNDEGCLSFPGIFVPIQRGVHARIRAQDLTGAYYELDGEGLLGRAFQHETDHLDGRLLIDRVGPVKRQIIKRKMRKESQSEETT
jgi:peptide deformylase